MKNINSSYLEYLFTTKSNIKEVLNDNDAKSILLNKHVVCTPAGFFHFKKPHSRRFKIKQTKKHFKDFIFEADNRIATTNELLLQNIYRKFNIKSAEHIPLTLDDKNTNIKYGVVSEDFISDELDYTPLYNLFFNYENLPFYRSSAQNNTIIRNQIGKKSIDSLKLSILGCHKLEHILDHKYDFLQILTEKCFDQIIINYLLSVFDFSDDDHLTNTLLIKTPNSTLFSDIYIFDKESTSFGYHCAKGKSINEIKKRTLGHKDYNGLKISGNNTETFDIRKAEIIHLIRNGKLDKKYVEVLNKISNINYYNLATQIEHKYGIETQPNQIDMLKYGSEMAGDIYHKMA